MYKRICHECRLLVLKRNIKLGNVGLRIRKLQKLVFFFFFWIGITSFVKFVEGKNLIIRKEII